MFEASCSHYSGCGNDFLFVFDDKDAFPCSNASLISKLCNLKGSQVDGFIVVKPSPKADFQMRYFNSDGGEAAMCGNGCRCLMKFVQEKLEFPSPYCKIETKERFITLQAIGDHVCVEMGHVEELGWNISLSYENKNIVVHHLNTGVPHLVTFVPDVEKVDVQKLGSFLRYHERFQPQGANVNFIQKIEDQQASYHALIRTYERGVERETLACGTGATASSLAMHTLFQIESPIRLKTRSSEFLEIEFERKNNRFENVTLTGPATWIQDGHLIIDPESSHFDLKLAC